MADTNKYVQTNIFYLAGSGTIIGATSISLTSFTDIYGNVLTMSDFGMTGYITLEPDTTNEEAATFTGVTANTNGTYTLTGVNTVLAKAPYTQTSGLVRQHSGGTKVVVTDNVAFWDTFANKGNDETITGEWQTTFVPTNANDLATKSYVDNVAIAGAPNASTTVKGIGTVSVAPVSSTAPIFVGDNDPRVVPSTGISGGILGWTSTTTRASSVLLTTHALIVGGGAGATPTPLASLGTSTTVLHGNASGNPTFSAVSLTTDVSGQLPVANGGTGITTGLSGLLGTWGSATADGNGHQVTTDGFIVVYGATTGAGIGTINVKSDSSSTPTTVRAIDGGTTTTTPASITIPVKKNDYYSITATGTMSVTAAFFIPLGN